MAGTAPRAPRSEGKVVRVVFIALMLDLLAFTMPLPLFPRLIEDFVNSEARNPALNTTLLSQTLHAVRTLRAYLFSFASSTSQARLAAFPAQWDLTILGGLLASLFSFCQFFISPFLGRLSDRYGRKKVLLVTMIGNLLSAALWLKADSFGLYAASRLIGGLSEGNVQLSIACITDVTSPATRSRSLALVGFAFAIAFTVGPSLGAYFSSRTLGRGSVLAVPPALATLVPGLPEKVHLNSYAVPAAITLVLLTVETIYLGACLPETRGWSKKVDEPTASTATKPTSPPVSRSPAERLARLRRLQFIHFAFLFFLAGAEFTLCFLTHNIFDYSNLQNGRLLGVIGILSSLLQGGYVRRRTSTPAKTAALALSGVRTCAVSLALLAVLPPRRSPVPRCERLRARRETGAVGGGGGVGVRERDGGQLAQCARIVRDGSGAVFLVLPFLDRRAVRSSTREGCRARPVPLARPAWSSHRSARDDLAVLRCLAIGGVQRVRRRHPGGSSGDGEGCEGGEAEGEGGEEGVAAAGTAARFLDPLVLSFD